ncbi:MAG TPA: hypothetical protein EYG27_02210, partial [Dehalococcoidia bacterium]|nr:hypothetical protein [Dehalococcoidia bacterium]
MARLLPATVLFLTSSSSMTNVGPIRRMQFMPDAWLFLVICCSFSVLVGCGTDSGNPSIEISTETSPTPTSELTSLQETKNPPTVVTSIPISTTPTEPPTPVPVEQLMTGDVLEAVPRNLVEIEMLLVRDANGKVWEFATEGPIGIDAAHLLVHRDIG